MLIIFSFFIFFLSLFFFKYSGKLLSRFFTIYPNKRSSHMVKKLSAGGIVFIFPILFIYLFLEIKWIIVLIPIMIIGLIDDFIGVSYLIRLIFQGLTVALIIINSNLPSDLPYFYLIISLLMVVGVGVINFINFMDGLDGLVGLSFLLIISFYSFFIDLNFLLFIPSLSCFLIYNWHPSKIFMGNVGSYLLGSLFVIFVLNTKTFDQSVAIAFSSSPLLLDAFICLIRRLLDKQDVKKAHQQHLYQRLYLAGWSHDKVSLIYAFLSLFIISSYLLLGLKSCFIGFFITLLVEIYLDRKKALPFQKLSIDI